MRVFIQTDLEGISGCVAGGYGFHRSPELERQYLDLMMGEINAVVEGCVKGGADEIVVMEAHRVDLAKLHPAAKLARGVKVAALLERYRFDAGMFVGQHARTGLADGVRSHTGSSKCILEFSVNGRSFGELGLTGGMLGTYGTPVVFLAGDDCCCREAEEFFPGCTTVAVEEAFGVWGAVCRPPASTAPELTAAAARALQRIGEVPPLRFEGQVTFRIEFAYAAIADDFCVIPGTRRIAPRVVECTGEDFRAAYRLGYSTLAAVLRRYES